MSALPKLYPVEPWMEGLFPDSHILFDRRPHPLIGPWCYFEIGKRPMARLQVICSAMKENDGKRWLHVSCSHPAELPSYAELCLVKDVFIGKERKAIQVFAPASEHVSFHPHVLHLWSCLDGDGLPDFRKDGLI